MKLSLALLLLLHLSIFATKPVPGQPSSGASEISPAVPIVVIDPGHPSEISSGKGLQHGVTELDINWQVSRKVVERLAKGGKVRPIMTRDVKDRMTRNRARSKIANDSRAALMVRLHCDTGSSSGFTVYFPDAQGTSEGFTGPSMEVIASSAIAARALHQALAEVLSGKLRDGGIKTDRQTAVGGKLGALIGSIFSEVPVVTLEMVYLSNASDAAFISKPENQDLMADAVEKGILRFLGL